MAEAITAIIGGTGLGNVLAGHLIEVKMMEVATPFGRPSGGIMMGRMAGRRVAFINRHGEGHRFGPGQTPYRANIYALKTLGVRSIIASGAVGSLRRQIKPREVVVPDQVIDKTFRRECSFFDDYGAVHCEMARPFCGRIRQAMVKAAEGTAVKLHDGGTYVCMEGPQFSTRAESLMHRKWGGDLIGMTAMPEAKLAREAQMCYAMLALVSDYDCWREPADVSDKQTLLHEILDNLNAAVDNAIAVIAGTLEQEAQLCDDACPCRKSLEKAVWTDREIVPAEKQKALAVLFE